MDIYSNKYKLLLCPLFQLNSYFLFCFFLLLLTCTTTTHYHYHYVLCYSCWVFSHAPHSESSFTTSARCASKTYSISRYLQFRNDVQQLKTRGKENKFYGEPIARNTDSPVYQKAKVFEKAYSMSSHNQSD